MKSKILPLHVRVLAIHLGYPNSAIATNLELYNWLRENKKFFLTSPSIDSIYEALKYLNK